ncbi:MAG: IMP cyclohydrolase [Chitinivibrionales bacterium]|nr:IMP cyclohydrolase [Chitinivibrionales bacterium]
MQDLKAAYKTIMDDHFPETMEISFSGRNGKQTLIYEKASWVIDGVRKGLRYGENPGQEAALYKLINGNITLGGVTSIMPGKYLASDIELLQSGKHPGKINITDIDNALNILRYFSDTPCTVIVKHNDPCGVARGNSPSESYHKALMADRIAAFGGAIAINREVDKETAERICESYSEVIAAPSYAPGVAEIFAQKKNLRVMQISAIENLGAFIGRRFIDFKSLIDGGVIAQWSYSPSATTRDKLIPAQSTYKGTEYRINRPPTDSEYDDLLFGWLVESGITSNSVIYVKDGVTVGIGTGEQDRVGVAEIARNKAYRKLADRICWEKHTTSYALLNDTDARAAIDAEVAEKKGGLTGSCMISDAFFPFRDGVDVGIREGVSAILQPGGSLRDFESIEACNEADVAMVFTGERSFKH